MEYLKLFSSHTDYEEYVTGGAMVKPNVSYCEDVKDVHYNPIHDYNQDYFTTVALEDGTISFTPLNSNVISYSIDNGNTWVVGNSVNVVNGDSVMWKGTMTPQLYNGIGKFDATSNFEVQGNTMSLLYGDDFKNQLSLEGKGYCFYNLFRNSTKLISSENLSLLATTLADGCYGYMFYNCTNLTSTPELPATTLASGCYVNMFSNCTSLTSAPELPATALVDGCYIAMFNGCTSLTFAPQLPATTLASNCYAGMFARCTSLTSAPELLATTLAESCYNGMFGGCTGLTSAPELPATTLASNCYASIFGGCTSLNYIKAMFTTTPSSTYTSNWVNGVASNGTFVKNSAATWNPEEVRGVNGVPTNWTVETASE